MFIFLPVIIVIIGLIVVIKLIRLISSKNIGIKEIIYGILTSIILYGLIALDYIIEGIAFHLTPFYRIPIVMILMPFIAHLVAEKIEIPRAKFISKILLLSIIITVIFGSIFHEIFFDIMEHVGTEKIY